MSDEKGIAKITPFHDQVLLTPIEAASHYGDSKLIIPEAHRQPVNQGTVVDKGPLCSDNVKLGDILFFPLHSEARLGYRGNKFILVSESAVLGSITETKG